MGKIGALWNLFRVGESVDDPAKWKTGGITAAMLVPVILAARQALERFGVSLPLSDAEAWELGAGVLVVVHIVFTLITSKSVGIAPARADGGAVDARTAAATAAGPDAPADVAGDLSQQLHDQLQTRATDPFAGDHGA